MTMAMSYPRKMIALRRWRNLFLGVLLSSSSFSIALALPTYARKYDMTCNQCHSAFPTLNEYGRDFKLNGYRPDGGPDPVAQDKKMSERLFLEMAQPLSLRMHSRIYDKTQALSRAQFLPAYEIEMYYTGNVSKEFSFFSEIETEPEDGGGLILETLAAGFHPMRGANAIGGIGQVFFTDPYNTLKDNGTRMTRNRRAPLNAGFPSGHALRSQTQFFTFNGKAARFYYSASIATGEGNGFNGTDTKDGVARLAYDFPSVHVGAFYWDGNQLISTAPNVRQGYKRTGIDFQVEAGDFTVLALAMEAEDEVFTGLTLTGEPSNKAGYLEAFYVFKRDDDPWLVPLLRYETVESNDGADDTTGVVGALKWYVRSNIDANIEYMKLTDVPGTGPEGHRFTLFFNFLL